MRKLEVLYKGRMQTLGSISKDTGIMYRTLYKRVVTLKLPIDVAVSTQHLHSKTEEQKLESLKKRLLSKYTTDKNTGCWNFSGSLVNRYGCIGYGTNNLLKAHRASYVVHFGEIPDHLDCCHSCDNPACINPDHLFLGTAKDNMDDMIRKGRKAINPKGDNSFKHTLSDKQVAEIRDRYKGEWGQQTKLAIEYGVKQPTISAILLNKTRV